MTDRRIFCREFAEKMAKRAGQPYRPSNGSEGMIFEEAFCNDCTKVEGCTIYGNALCFDTDHPAYPKEWIIGDDGQPKCTAHEEAKS